MAAVREAAGIQEDTALAAPRKPKLAAVLAPFTNWAESHKPKVLAVSLSRSREPRHPLVAALGLVDVLALALALAVRAAICRGG